VDLKKLAVNYKVVFNTKFTAEIGLLSKSYCFAYIVIKFCHIFENVGCLPPGGTSVIT